MLKINKLNAKIDNKEILKEFSLNINPGEVHAIMGPNGSGKSTLANVLSGKNGYEVSGGLTYQDQNLKEIPIEERAQKGIFLAFQYPLEIPGVNTSNFLKTSLNSVRKSKGKKELDTLTFLKLIKEKALELNGHDYEMDHSYKFYIALCHLQLNNFEKAQNIFKKDIKKQVDKWGEAHYIDQFYYGITKYELGKWQEAIDSFDKSLKVYTNFSDAKYYKALCLYRLNKNSEFQELLLEAKNDARLGNTFNEDNSIYEPYPYKVRW